MKFLKFLLIICLLLVVCGIGGVFFQNQLLDYMTKTKNTSFENINYSIGKNELNFSNFVLNGKSLGKGKANVKIERSGFLGVVPNIKLTNVKLEDLDLATIGSTQDNIVDVFIEKIETPIIDSNKEKTTEQYLEEIKTEIENINVSIDSFMNNKIRLNIENTNRLKQEYLSLKDLKSRAQKISEINREIKPLSKIIYEESKKIEEVISKVELERNIMLDNVSEDIANIEKIVDLNNESNINSYVLLDKGKVISNTLKGTLKTVKLIDEIKKSDIKIESISINGDEIVFNNLDKDIQSISGEVRLKENVKANISFNSDKYNIIYNIDSVSVNSNYTVDKKIETLLTYTKNDLLENKNIDLVSNLIFEDNNLIQQNKTVLTEEEKTLLLQKTSTLETTRYEEIMKNYLSQTEEVENLIMTTYNKKTRLELLQKELLLLNKIIDINSDTDNNNDINNNKENN